MVVGTDSTRNVATQQTTKKLLSRVGRRQILVVAMLGLMPSGACKGLPLLAPEYPAAELKARIPACI